jgi:hypothetical protein
VVDAGFAGSPPIARVETSECAVAMSKQRRATVLALPFGARRGRRTLAGA